MIAWKETVDISKLISQNPWFWHSSTCFCMPFLFYRKNVFSLPSHCNNRSCCCWWRQSPASGRSGGEVPSSSDDGDQEVQSQRHVEVIASCRTRSSSGPSPHDAKGSALRCSVHFDRFLRAALAGTILIPQGLDLMLLLRCDKIRFVSVFIKIVVVSPFKGSDHGIRSEGRLEYVIKRKLWRDGAVAFSV